MADYKKKHKFANNFSEIKSLAAPPQQVIQTMWAMFLVLGKPFERGREWINCRRYLASPTVVEWIDAFDPQTCSHEVAQEAREVIKDITVEQIKKVNMAAVALFIWTDAQINLVLSQGGSGTPAKEA